jgi:hypothetical protein
VAAVTLGSASVRLAARWYGELVRAPLILAAYDRDEAGQKGAARCWRCRGGCAWRGCRMART